MKKGTHDDPFKYWFLGNIQPILKHVGSSMTSLESIDEKKELIIHPVPEVIIQSANNKLKRRNSY